MSDKVLLTKNGRKFITYLKSDTKKIEAAKKGGFREATTKEESDYLIKCGFVESKPEAKQKQEASTN